MKKNIGSFLICLVFIGFGFGIIKREQKLNDINYLLETKSYSYLSSNVKEYIKNYYEETGDILLTEKNKKTNEPYLNDDFISYLDSDSKEDYEVIPSSTVVDFVAPAEAPLENYPSSYDLRDVNGNNYVTSVKNQGSEGLCWAYAINSYLESMFLISTGEVYDFDEHQLDYATASDGLLNAEQLYKRSGTSYERKLNGGAWFNNPEEIVLDSLGMASQSWTDEHKTAIENFDTIPAGDVYNFNTSDYQVDSTYHYPRLDFASASQSDIDSYITSVKSAIVKGGAYLGGIGPNSDCSFFLGQNEIVYNNGYCSGGGHAMHIIGWDDDFEYKVCTSDDKKHYSEDISNCSSDNLVSGKGVWIVKNSWGDSHAYVYFTYNSKIDIYTINSLSKRDWDNFYTDTTGTEITKPTNTTEQITKLKIELPDANTTYNVSLITDANTTSLGQIKSTYPGFYELDLSKDDIKIQNNFKIKLSKDKLFGEQTITKAVHVYTNNIDKTKIATTLDATYEAYFTNENNYAVRITSRLRNVDNSANVSYRLKDTNGKVVTTNITSEENAIFANNLYSKIHIDSAVTPGNYILEVLDDNTVFSSSKVNIKDNVLYIGGEGTSANPYKITNNTQLDMVRLRPSSSFVLERDLDLTYDTQDKNGKFYNSGKGFEPISNFTGNFNGLGHTIKGLYINSTLDDVGLFSDISYYTGIVSKDQVVLDYGLINNIKFDNVNITGKKNVGVVAGTIDLGNKYKNVTISSIAVNSGTVVSTSKTAGGIFGVLSYSSDYGNVEINSLFNAASINAATDAGGILGEVINSKNNNNLSLEALENLGNVTGSNAGGLIGNLLTQETPLAISASINNGKIKGTGNSCGILCSSITSNVLVVLTNDFDTSGSFTNSNTGLNINKNNNPLNIEDYGKEATYTNLPLFNTYYTIYSNHIPILSNATYTLTNLVKEITIKEGKRVDLKDYLEPKERINNSKVTILNNDNNYITYDDSTNIISGLKVGEATLNFINYDDIYTEEVTIKVEAISDKYYIKYDANGGTGTMDIETLTLNTKTKLSPNQFKKEGYKFLKWNTKADGSGDSYSDNQEVINLISIPEETITLYAIYERSKEDIEEVVTIDSENKKIIFSQALTPVNLLKNFTDKTIKVYNQKQEEISIDAYIGTGYQVEIYEGDNLLEKYTACFIGDVNGDGVIDISDVAKLYTNIMNVTTDDLVTLAGDTNGDKVYDISDVALLYSEVMKK